MIISELEIRLSAQIARLQQDMDNARRVVGSTMDRISASVAGAMKMFAGLAAGLTVAVFARFVKGGIDAADAMDELREKTGLLMKDVAGVRLIFQREGFGDQELVTSMSKLSKAITTGGGGLAALKVATKDASGEFRSTQAVLYDVADRFAKMENGAQKSALAMDIFGKSGVSLIPMLNGGSEGMRDMAEMAQKLGLVISQETATAAGDFNDTLSLIGQGSQGVAQGIAAELLPTLNSLAGSFLTSMTSGDKLASTANVLGGVLKILYTVGVGIVEVFSTVGKAVGAAAAMTVAVLSGNFKEAATIHKSLAADIGEGWASTATAVSDAWTGAGADTVAAMAKVGKAQKDVLAAQEARDAAAKKDAAAYAASAKAAKDFAGALEIETAQVGLSADQIKMMAAARAAAKAPTAELRMEIMKAALALDIATKAEAEKVAADKAVAESNKRAAEGLAEFTKLQQAYGDQVAKSIQAANDEAAKNVELVATFGMTKNAIEQMELARLQDQLAQRASTGLTLDEIAALEALIEAKKRSAAATGSLEVLEKQKKASDEAAAAQVSFWKSIDQTAHDTFISIANGSKDAATRLKETFKNVFFDWLYQMTIKKWIVNIGTSTDTSGIGGIASALGGDSSGGGGILGTASNWLSIGKTIYSGFSTGIAASLGGQITTLGNLFGSQAVSAFGTGMTLTTSQAGTAAGAYAAAGNTTAAGGLTAGAGAAGAIPIIGWIIAGMMANNAYFKQGWQMDGQKSDIAESLFKSTAKGNFFGPLLGSASIGIGAGDKALQKLGLNDQMASLISGSALWTRAFGHQKATVESQGLRGTINAGGIDAENYANILQKGGWFRSNKRNVVRAGLNNETDAEFDGTIKSMITAVKGFGKVLGLEATTIDGYTKAFDIKFTGKAQEDNAAVSKLFADVGDELSMRLVPGLAAFAKEGEAAITTLQRLTSDYMAVDNILAATGQSIKLFGVAGIEVREQMIAAAGGLDALASGVSYFQQNWLSEAEQLAPVQKQVTEALAAMGMSSVKTNDQFKAAVLGIDLSTKAGAELYVQMLALAPAFKTVADAQEAAVRALAEADAARIAQAKAAADALAETNKGYQDQIDALLKANMSATEVRALETAGMHSSTLALYDRLAGLKASIDAENAAADAIKKAQESAAAVMTGLGNAFADSMTKAKEAAKAFRALNDALLVGDSSTLNPEQRYLEAKRQFETADPANLAAAEKAFLDASKGWFGGSAGYAKDFAAVLALNSAMATQKDAEAAAIADFWKNFVASGGWAGMNGSHKDGLDFVPFDGYRAELHRGERVQTAAAVRDGDAAAEQTNELLRELIDKLDASLGADKTQRGAVGVAVLDKLDTLINTTGDGKRVAARSAASNPARKGVAA